MARLLEDRLSLSEVQDFVFNHTCDTVKSTDRKRERMSRAPLDSSECSPWKRSYPVREGATFSGSRADCFRNSVRPTLRRRKCPCERPSSEP